VYAPENQVFSIKMGKENVPKANQEIDYRVYAPENQVFSTMVMIRNVPNKILILGEEVERNTSPLSRSPL